MFDEQAKSCFTTLVTFVSKQRVKESAERHNAESWRVRFSNFGGEGHQELEQAFLVHE